MMLAASLPSWERGLKFFVCARLYTRRNVAPLVGARIEISMGLTEVDLTKVAPLVGARIEIATSSAVATGAVVAPLVGARIEIGINSSYMQSEQCRSPRGSED